MSFTSLRILSAGLSASVVVLNVSVEHQHDTGLIGFNASAVNLKRRMNQNTENNNVDEVDDIDEINFDAMQNSERDSGENASDKSSHSDKSHSSVSASAGEDSGASEHSGEPQVQESDDNDDNSDNSDIEHNRDEHNSDSGVQIQIGVKEVEEPEEEEVQEDGVHEDALSQPNNHSAETAQPNNNSAETETKKQSADNLLNSQNQDSQNQNSQNQNSQNQSTVQETSSKKVRSSENLLGSQQQSTQQNSDRKDIKKTDNDIINVTKTQIMPNRVLRINTEFTQTENTVQEIQTENAVRAALRPQELNTNSVPISMTPSMSPPSNIFSTSKAAGPVPRKASKQIKKVNHNANGGKNEVKNEVNATNNKSGKAQQKKITARRKAQEQIVTESQIMHETEANQIMPENEGIAQASAFFPFADETSEDELRGLQRTKEAEEMLYRNHLSWLWNSKQPLILRRESRDKYHNRSDRSRDNRSQGQEDPGNRSLSQVGAAGAIANAIPDNGIHNNNAIPNNPIPNPAVVDKLCSVSFNIDSQTSRNTGIVCEWDSEQFAFVRNWDDIPRERREELIMEVAQQKTLEMKEKLSEIERSKSGKDKSGKEKRRRNIGLREERDRFWNNAVDVGMKISNGYTTLTNNNNNIGNNSIHIVPNGMVSNGMVSPAMGMGMPMHQQPPMYQQQQQQYQTDMNMRNIMALQQQLPMNHNGGQLSMSGGQMSVNGGQMSMSGGQMSMNGGQNNNMPMNGGQNMPMNGAQMPVNCNPQQQQQFPQSFQSMQHNVPQQQQHNPQHMPPPRPIVQQSAQRNPQPQNLQQQIPQAAQVPQPPQEQNTPQQQERQQQKEQKEGNKEQKEKSQESSSPSNLALDNKYKFMKSS